MGKRFEGFRIRLVVAAGAATFAAGPAVPARAQSAAQAAAARANQTGLRRPARIMPIVGENKRVMVKAGETLYGIARAHDVTMGDVRRANGLTGSRLKAGRELVIPQRHILPLQPDEGIVLNIPEYGVYVFREGRLAARHAVAVGRPSWQTAIGEYSLRNKAKDPTWTPPKSLVDREGVSADPVPPGPDNPLGDRWMGWTAPGYGFHSTNSPRSIGSAASHGCVRLYPEWARRMFDQVSVGMTIHALYEPVKIGREGGHIYLSVAPDVYGKEMATRERVEGMLAEVGLLPLVSEPKLKSILARKTGFPTPLIGEAERMEVNGLALTTAVPPVLLPGTWVVPGRAVVEALGGQVSAGPDGAVQVTFKNRTLQLRAGETAATLDGEAIELPAKPALLEGVLMLPLRPLLQLTGAQFEHETGASPHIRLTMPSTSPNPP